MNKNFCKVSYKSAGRENVRNKIVVKICRINNINLAKTFFDIYITKN